MAVAAAALDPWPSPVSGRARVSDGDSFRLGDDRVRLLGLDAPELSQECTDAAGKAWPCGREARDRMAELLAGGPVDCRPEDTDQFGRLLATCRVAGRDLGSAMVAEGMATSAGRYFDEEQQARGDRLGIWAGDFDQPRQWRDDNPRGQGAWGLLSGFGL